MVKVIGPRDPKDSAAINTTSRSVTWSKGLSPFFVGPVDLYCDETAWNVENAWQFSKVYQKHIGADGNPSAEYFEWARSGWRDKKAHRYPMGKGAIPLFSWWDGKKFSYIEARKHIYIPLYAKAVSQTSAFEQLKEIYLANGKVTLWDFDGYDHVQHGKSYTDVINDPDKKCGHAFVLAMLLENCLESCLDKVLDNKCI